MPIDSYASRPLSAVHRDLQGPLEIPHRSITLPPVYMWVGEGPHPQTRTSGLMQARTDGITYVTLVDTLTQGDQTTRDVAETESTLSDSRSPHEGM